MAAARVGATASVIAGGVALAMAAVSALALGVADAIWRSSPATGSEALSLLFVVGWALAAWAALLAVGVAVHLIRVLAARRRIAPVELVLIVATGAVIAATIALHPLVGTGEARAAPDGSGEPWAAWSEPHVIARS